jgi:hypothetical protein
MSNILLPASKGIEEKITADQAASSNTLIPLKGTDHHFPS